MLAHRCGNPPPRPKRAKATAKPAQAPDLPIRPPAAHSWSFPRDVLSANQTVYAHWSAYAKDKRDWAAVVQPFLPQMGGRYRYSTWRLTRHYGGRSRLMDAINMAAGFKPLIDLLTEGQVIFDDSPTYFRCDYAPQVRCEAASHCVLELLTYGTTPDILS